MSRKGVAQMLAGVIVANDAKQMDVSLQPGDVGCGVDRSAWDMGAFLQLHDGDGRFRRDAMHAAPEVFVEHHVANHKDALARKSLQDVGQVRVHQDVLSVAGLLSGLLPVANSVDQVGGGDALQQREECNPTAVGLDHGHFGDGPAVRWSVFGSFAVDVRLQQLQGCARRQLGKDQDVIDALQSGQDLRPLNFRQDGSALPFS